jgi:hypothetical protein
MAEYNLPLNPENAVNNISLETPPYTSNLVGGAISAQNTFFSLPTNLGINKLNDFITNEFSPGKFLTKEEADIIDGKTICIKSNY